MVEQTEGYPGWNPNPDSDHSKYNRASYQRLFKVEPAVKAMHAGLGMRAIPREIPLSGYDLIWTHHIKSTLTLRTCQYFHHREILVAYCLDVLQHMPAE